MWQRQPLAHCDDQKLCVPFHLVEFVMLSYHGYRDKKNKNILFPDLHVTLKKPTSAPLCCRTAAARHRPLFSLCHSLTVRVHFGVGNVLIGLKLGMVMSCDLGHIWPGPSWSPDDECVW